MLPGQPDTLSVTSSVSVTMTSAADHSQQPLNGVIPLEEDRLEALCSRLASGGLQTVGMTILVEIRQSTTINMSIIIISSSSRLRPYRQQTLTKPLHRAHACNHLARGVDWVQPGHLPPLSVIEKRPRAFIRFYNLFPPIFWFASVTISSIFQTVL